MSCDYHIKIQIDRDSEISHERNRLARIQTAKFEKPSGDIEGVLNKFSGS